MCIILAAVLSLVLGSLSVPATAQQDYTFKDIDGVEHGSLDDSGNRATVVYFVMTDCPISNRFAPEIGRICTDYKAKGVDCFLAYVDSGVTNEAIREHIEDYSHDCCPAINDARQVLAGKAGAIVTPEAAVFSARGEVLYRGRINDFYAALGKARRKARVHDLRTALDEVLAGQPVTNPRTEAIGCYIPPKDL
ncbi:MAG: hypothetical protein O2968_19795 [Acidobacteria bacterium]|nr:hypothetical protein [Acidobacteriota bacterium]